MGGQLLTDPQRSKNKLEGFKTHHHKINNQLMSVNANYFPFQTQITLTETDYI